MRKLLCVLGVVVSFVRVAPASAQALPTSQPNYLQITIEEVKVGHDDDHSKLEAGWPAAFEKANSPYYGMGMVAMTGAPQAWFLTPYDSNKAIGESLRANADDPVLSAELSRLARADTVHITNARNIMLRARKDLSHGAFPDVGKQRFYEITLFRVRSGHEQQFEEVAKAYGAAAGRAAPDTSYRVYEVVAGSPGPTFYVISSVVSHAEIDKEFSDGDATMKAFTKDEMALMQKFSTDGLINSETQRFRVDPNMCYVPKDVRASDPAFWNRKKPAAKTTTAPQPQR
ncbi:MAG TPA: hypothetical protein VL225_00700 [Vicinamibacterales bacterium]|jgi:hypothetical protein|nr:hypothetical protein [Vicinamibacterales bacterium]